MSDLESSDDKPDQDLGIDPRLRDTPRYDFEQLSGGRKMIFVEFGNVRYELKRTKSGRLVLHK